MADGPANVIEREMAALTKLAAILGADVRLAVAGKLQDRDGRWWRVTLEQVEKG